METRVVNYIFLGCKWEMVGKELALLESRFSLQQGLCGDIWLGCALGYTLTPWGEMHGTVLVSISP